MRLAGRLAVRHDVAMHIDAVPNRTSRPTYLLRESYREGKRVRKRTLANLSTLSDEQIEAIRAVLAGTVPPHVAEIVLERRPRSRRAQCDSRGVLPYDRGALHRSGPRPGPGRRGLLSCTNGPC